MPNAFTQVCIPITEHSSKNSCMGHNKRWRSEYGMLSAGSGVPPGVRLGLRLRTYFTKWHPGLLEVKFKTQNL